MLILSKFNDYYDSAGLAYGVDTKLVYERKTEVIDNKLLNGLAHKLLFNYYSTLPRNVYFGAYRIERYIIGFCGTLYPLWYYYRGNGSQLYINESDRYYPLYFTDPNKLINHLEENGLDDLKDLTKKLRTGTRIDNMNKVEPIKVPIDIFYNLGSPSFLYNANTLSSVKIEVNPILKNYKLQDSVSPLNAFQEVSMFLGGLRSKNENIVTTTGDDRVIVYSKGMDPDISFHQTAPTKKERRKMNKENKRKNNE